MNRRAVIIITLVLIAVALMAAVGVRLAGAVTRQQDASRCRERMMHIRHAMLQYAQQYAVFPPTVESLVTEKMLPAAEVNCPLGGQYHYCAAGRKRSEIQPQSVLMFEDAANHPEMGNVLYGDGEVRGVPTKRIEALRRLLDRTTAKAASRIVPGGLSPVQSPARPATDPLE